MPEGIVTRWSEERTSVPWMTLLLSVVLLGVMCVYTLVDPAQQNALVESGGMQPARASAALAQPWTTWFGSAALTVATAVFIHANWLHLAGNLAYLWVFGISVERRASGLGLFLVFTLGGALANALVALRLSGLDATVIGASGAVSAVVGCYLGLFPRHRIGLYVPLGLYLQFARVPALVVIGSWFTLQLVYAAFDPTSGVVAFWTHLTGFTLGVMMAFGVRAVEQIRRS